jgi:hypothetical protein
MMSPKCKSSDAGHLDMSKNKWKGEITVRYCEKKTDCVMCLCVCVCVWERERERERNREREEEREGDLWDKAQPQEPITPTRPH